MTAKTIDTNDLGKFNREIFDSYYGKYALFFMRLLAIVSVYFMLMFFIT